MSPIPEPTPEEFRELWRELRASARKRGSLNGLDVEDLAAEALLAVVAEPEPGAPLSLLQRARVKLHDRRVEILRFRERRFEPVELAPLDESLDQARPDEAVEEFEVLETIRVQLGGDVEALSRYLYADMTLREVAELPGWDQQRVERARKALKRGKTRVLPALLGEDEHDGNQRGGG
jgi:hypothetical protein